MTRTQGVITQFNRDRAKKWEPKRFINWELYNPKGEFVNDGDYSPSSPKSVAWMSRFIMWATKDGNVVVFRRQ